METFKLPFGHPILLSLFCCFLLCISHGADTLKPGEILSGNETLVSPRGVFELGFFSSPLGKVSNLYLGIWFKNDKYKKSVWVGNQDSPLVESSAALYIIEDGKLVLNDVRGVPTFLSSGVAATSNNTLCKLLDSGNLVLMEAGKIVWQSFDYPTDTFLPGMRLGFFNLNTNVTPRKQFLVSWSSPLNPSKGTFVFGMDENNRTQFNILRAIDLKSQAVGFWDGQTFMFFFQTKSKDYNFSFVSNKKETYLAFSNDGNTDVPSSWFELTPNGEIDEITMDGEEISFVNHSICQDGLAAVNSTECLTFLPSNCWTGDNFSEIKGVIPNSTTMIFPARMGLTDCELTCKSNCSCTAYAGYSGDNNMCLLYYGDKDLKKSVRANQTIYVRSSFSTDSDNQRIRNLLLKIVPPVVSLIMFTVILFLCCLLRRRSNRIGIDTSQSGLRKRVKLLSWFLRSNGTNNDQGRNAQELTTENIHELPMLSFSSISDATDSFSFTNKLGEGGFGPVYKGKLFDNEVAVKRLSKSSGQGFEEFKNEVQLISELQHRNLVKLLGYCIHQEEKILVYEYMANKSLDSFIFDEKRRTLLDWGQRMHIIEGVAQGLLYLHKYSRLRVIHRDMKTSNILLDAYMNPKISDFGMARICHENESQGITRRVVGTYGYMAPEYAVHGQFSTKSDIFSYGVILLEIVSGRRNTASFDYLNRSLSLLGYAWNLWKDDRAGNLLDPALSNSCHVHELQLCIQVALLCVQEDPEERPSMSDVISMLGNERTVLPDPTQPALSTYLSIADIDSPKRLRKPSQISVTISALQAR